MIDVFAELFRTKCLQQGKLLRFSVIFDIFFNKK